MYPTITPKTNEEKKSFSKHPRAYIEGKLEILRPFHPLIQSIHSSVIKNNLPDSTFYLFLAYYATARLIEFENAELERIQKSTEKFKI